MIYVGRVKDEFADDDLITEFDLQNAKYFSNIKILRYKKIQKGWHRSPSRR